MAVVGITSRCSEKDLEWLMKFVKETFWDFVFDVKYLPISDYNKERWRGRVSRCWFGILYHSKRQGSMKITDVDGALYDEELQWLCSILDRDRVLVVLDDLEDLSDSERQRIQGGQSSLHFRSSKVLFFPERGKTAEADKHKEVFLNFFGYNPTHYRDDWRTAFIAPSLHCTMNQQRSAPPKQRQNLRRLVSDRQPVASILRIYIFSRAAQSNYEWLVKWLKTTYRMRQIDVYGVYITNKSTSFYSELQHCSFVILYHTLKQGRLNITDVTDSLYDEELRDLSKHLGKENIIVVLDDLKNTDSSEKSRILGQQPSIGSHARELFLFDEEEKKPENLEKINQIIAEKTQKDPVMDTGPTENPKTVCRTN